MSARQRRGEELAGRQNRHQRPWQGAQSRKLTSPCAWCAGCRRCRGGEVQADRGAAPSAQREAGRRSTTKVTAAAPSRSHSRSRRITCTCRRRSPAAYMRARDLRGSRSMAAWPPRVGGSGSVLTARRVARSGGRADQRIVGDGRQRRSSTSAMTARRPRAQIGGERVGLATARRRARPARRRSEHDGGGGEARAARAIAMPMPPRDRRGGGEERAIAEGRDDRERGRDARGAARREKTIFSARSERRIAMASPCPRRRRGPCRLARPRSESTRPPAIVAAQSGIAAASAMGRPSGPARRP